MENEETLNYLGKRKNDKRLRPVDNIEDLYAGDVFYFTCIGKKEDFERRVKFFPLQKREETDNEEGEFLKQAELESLRLTRSEIVGIYGEGMKADSVGMAENVYEHIKKDSRYGCTLQPEPNNPKEYWLEIMPRNATKANAILKLKQMWNCDRVVSFGDGANDIPMFRISDECYAMENAVDALKEIATGVIGSNDADRVANFLKQHVDISQVV